MDRPINVNLHESLKDVEDRSCLVMDDDGPFVQRMARALAQRGFVVSAVSTVSEGKDIARLNPPAFAVLDLRLEDGSGLDVVEVLHKHRPDARAVILTGAGDAFCAGMDLAEMLETSRQPEAQALGQWLDDAVANPLAAA